MPVTGRIREVNWSKRLLAASTISVVGLLSVGLLGGYTIYTQSRETARALTLSQDRADAASKAEVAILVMGKAQTKLILAEDAEHLRVAAVETIRASSTLDESVERLEKALGENLKVLTLAVQLKQVESLKMEVIKAAMHGNLKLARSELNNMESNMSQIERLSGELVDDENRDLLGAVTRQGKQARSTLGALGVLVITCALLSLYAGFELRARTLELARARTESELFINCVPSILIGTDEHGRVTRWNQTAAAVFGLDKQAVEGQVLEECAISWVDNFAGEIRKWPQVAEARHYEDLKFERGQQSRSLTLTVNPIRFDRNKAPELLITGADITEKRGMEEELRQAHKLEAIGQLAAGVAHEINTPVQFAGDNARFIKESWVGIDEILDLSLQLAANMAALPGGSESSEKFRERCEAIDIHYLKKEVPVAVDQSLEGLDRIARIVRAMKEFSHPGTAAMQPVDVNRAIDLTVTVASSEWRHVAEVKTEFDRALPPVMCNAGEFNQVILNLLINAAHAVGDVNREAGGMGVITLGTRWDGDCAEILIRDTGSGIPEEVGKRIFEPFFTTKEVGKGTGQGLALAHSVIVNKHGGKIWFESEVGKGTTFFLRMPLEQRAKAGA